MIDIKDIQKYEDAIADRKRYCKCGHSVTILEGNKKICSNCGFFVYLNPQDEFKEKVKKALREKKDEK